MAEECKNIEYDFRSLQTLDFHINSGIAVFGFFYVLFLNIHAISSYISILKRTKNSGKMERMNHKSFCALLSVLICSLILFIIYSLEFWIFRIYDSLNIDINAFQFCNIFQHLLYSSVIMYTWILYVYFSVRLETSFNSSALAFPTDCFVVIRILATIAVVFGISVAFIFSCGVPWNVEQRMVTDNNPWLCRNVVIWSWYWEFIYLCGSAMLLSGNIMNWIGYMNRLTKLIGMKLKYKLSFKMIIQEEMTDISKNMTSTFDVDEDMDDDVLYEHMDTSTPIQLQTIQQDQLRATIVSQSVPYNITQDSNNIPKSDIRRRRIARRKPDELRFYNLIRKQSVLTGVVSLSSVVLWSIQSLFDKGTIFILSDILINVSCVYLSVSWTKKCYNKLCSRLSKCCCCCCEDCIESKVARELKIEAKEQQKARGQVTI